MEAREQDPCTVKHNPTPDSTMKVKLDFLHRLHLDQQHFLLTGRELLLVKEFFDALDVRHMESLDDIQFIVFMTCATDLTEREALRVFDMLDVDDSGSIEFDEFYLLVCMLIAIKDGQEKHFMWRHSRTCFELLDEDASKSVSIEEFETIGLLFNISHDAAKRIFTEFDINDSKELTYDEFQMFALAAIDQQKRLESQGSGGMMSLGRSMCTVS